MSEIVATGDPVLSNLPFPLYLYYSLRLYKPTRMTAPQAKPGSQDNSLEYPMELREQLALDMLQRRVVGTFRSAAEMANVNSSTLRYRKLGSTPVWEANENKQKLTLQEEEFLVDRCDHLGKCGFPPTIEEVREHALYIYQQRVPDGTLGQHWVKDSFYRRHQEVKSRFSIQLDYKRALSGNNPKIISEFFSIVGIHILISIEKKNLI